MPSLDLLGLENRVDAIFQPFTRAGSPGCVVGIARGDDILLRRTYGLASIELSVPLAITTRFRIASVTKQFVVTAALMLQAEGRLGLDDPPQKYLPRLPAWPAPVSIDQMMRNTSGLPDFLQLLMMGGLGLEQPCRAEDIDDAIARSRHLNFAPGSRFLYSNTNFLLLGRIIEAVEGAPLGEVLARRIFQPLGLRSTELVTSTTAVVRGLATGYLAGQNGFERAAHGFPLAGEGGLVSNLNDLLLWSRHYDRPSLLPGGIPARLAERYALAGGSANPYARGVEHGVLAGLATLGHGGLWPGYRTEFLRLPEADLTVVVIANLGSADPHRLARRTALAALCGDPRAGGAEPAPAQAAIEPLAGTWYSAAELMLFELAWREGEPIVTRDGASFALIAGADGWLVAERGAYEFALRPAGADALDVAVGAGRIVRASRLAERTAPPADLAGTYVSVDSGATWHLEPGEAGLAVRVAGPLRAGGAAGAVRGVLGDVVEVELPTGWAPFLALARLERGGGGKPRGLTVSAGRIKEMRFDRIAG